MKPIGSMTLVFTYVKPIQSNTLMRTRPRVHLLQLDAISVNS